MTQLLLWHVTKSCGAPTFVNSLYQAPTTSFTKHCDSLPPESSRGTRLLSVPLPMHPASGSCSPAASPSCPPSLHLHQAFPLLLPAAVHALTMAGPEPFPAPLLLSILEQLTFKSHLKIQLTHTRISGCPSGMTQCCVVYLHGKTHRTGAYCCKDFTWEKHCCIPDFSCEILSSPWARGLPALPV